MPTGGKAALRFAPIAVLIGIFGTSVASYLREFPGIVETPYWYLTYGSGFIRRGLVGTLVSPFIVGRTTQDGLEVISWICALVALAYLAVIAVLATSVYDAQNTPARRWLWLALMAIAITSPGFPNLAHLFGLLDTILALLTAGLVVAILHGRLWLGVAIAIIGTFTHEAFLFLALPITAAAAWRSSRARWAAAAAASAILAATLAIWNFSDANFVWQPGVPIAPEDLQAFAHWQIGQGVVISSWPDLAPAIWLSDVAPLIGMATILCFIVPDRRVQAVVRVAAGTLFSISILVVATDSERLLAWGRLTCPMLCGIEALRQVDARTAQSGQTA